MFTFDLDPSLPRMSESLQTSTALCLRGLQKFSCLSFIGRVVIVNLPEGDLCYVYMYLFASHGGNNERIRLLIRITK